MPILLTTPFNPGQFDPGKTYPRAQIMHFSIDPSTEHIRVSVDFGDVVNEKWVSGNARDKMRSVRISGADYAAIGGAAPISGETVYETIKRLLYNYLTTKVQGFAGTIE